MALVTRLGKSIFGSKSHLTNSIWKFNGDISQHTIKRKVRCGDMVTWLLYAQQSSFSISYLHVSSFEWANIKPEDHQTEKHGRRTRHKSSEPCNASFFDFRKQAIYPGRWYANLRIFRSWFAHLHPSPSLQAGQGVFGPPVLFSDVMEPQSRGRFSLCYALTPF